MEMTRHIKSLYVRTHLNGRPVSKVLMDNGSVVNVMPLRMLRALGRRFNDMIETKVVVSAFTGEVSKTLGILPIDITIGNKTTLFAFFMIDSTANYNILLGRDWIHANWCVSLWTRVFQRASPLEWSRLAFCVVGKPFKKMVWSRHLFLFYFKGGKQNKKEKP